MREAIFYRTTSGECPVQHFYLRCSPQTEHQKSAISRIENHAGDIRLSTLHKYVRALGERISLEIR